MQLRWYNFGGKYDVQKDWFNLTNRFNSQQLLVLSYFFENKILIANYL